MEERERKREKESFKLKSKKPEFFAFKIKTWEKLIFPPSSSFLLSSTFFTFSLTFLSRTRYAMRDIALSVCWSVGPFFVHPLVCFSVGPLIRLSDYEKSEHARLGWSGCNCVKCVCGFVGVG